MNASSFVGRVGGLAVALGVGAAVYSGAAVAWADGPTSGSSSVQGSAGPKAAAASAKTAPRGGVKSSAPNRPLLNSPNSTLRASNVKSESAPKASEAADTTNALTAVPVAVSAPATLDPVTDSLPAAPIEVTTGSVLLAHSRRDTAVSTLPAAAASLTTPSQPPAAATELADVQNIALVMGGSGTPVPSASYIESVFQLYVAANSPDGTIPEQLVTPEGLYPITGVKSLPLGISVDQGNQILYDEILQQIAAGNTVTVFGYSQSAIISSLVMGPDNTGCINTSTCSIDPDAPVNFVLIGNEMNPNGGFLSRFPGLNLPSLGIEFYGPTPEDAFPVANYMLEYDGFADFPQYPLNALASFNAVMGIAFVHGQYPNLTQEQVDQAIALSTTSDTQDYYVIPTRDLPMLAPLRLIPLIGNPLADLLQPALRVIINIGYGDPKYGWSTSDGNVETPFAFLNDVDWGESIALFFEGVVQGVKDFVADISPGGVMSQELASYTSSARDFVTSLASSPDSFITGLQTVVTEAVYFVSNAAASLYSALLPTADIVNAIVTMLPAYAFDLFLEGIEQALSGDVIDGLLNAIGRPWAAAVGLVTTALGIEVLVLLGAVEGVFTGVVE